MRFGSGNARERMEATCSRLVEATREIGTWSWDDDYLAVLAVIKSEHEQAALNALTDLFPHAWSPTDITSAPEPVRHVCGVWGGLMTGQRLFVLDPTVEPMLFATWWPWGNRLKSSLRVSCSARSETVARADPQGLLRAQFGL